MIKRHTRPNPAKQIKGGVAEREAAIHISNVMLIGSDGKPTRIGMKVERVGNKNMHQDRPQDGRDHAASRGK